MPSVAYFRIFAKIVQTRAETNLFGYAECRLFSHFCKDSANEGRNKFIWLCRVPPIFAFLQR